MLLISDLDGLPVHRKLHSLAGDYGTSGDQTSDSAHDCCRQRAHLLSHLCVYRRVCVGRHGMMNGDDTEHRHPKGQMLFRAADAGRPNTDRPGINDFIEVSR